MPCRRLVLAVACVLALPGMGHAACGGGGGAGYGSYSPPPDPTYTPTSDAFSTTDASADALQRTVLVVLQRHHQPIGIWDDSLVALSKTKTTPFVLAQDDTAAAFATRWGIQRLPAVALCDGAGNLLAVTGSPLTAQGVHQLLAQAGDARAALRAGLEALLAQAREADAKGREANALAEVAQVLHFHGLDVCVQAQALQADMLARGKAAIVAASANSTPGAARSALTAIVTRYRDTSIADEARQVLHQLQ